MPCQQVSKEFKVVVIAGMVLSGLFQLTGLLMHIIYDYIHFVHVQTTSALAICFFVVIYLMYYTRTGRPMLKPVALSAYLSLLSGILSFTPATLCINLWMRNYIYGDALSFFYVFLTGVGGGIALVISVILMSQTYSKLGTNEQRRELPPVHNQQDEDTLL